MDRRFSIPLAAVVLAVAATWWLGPDRRAVGEQAPVPAAAVKWEYGTLSVGGQPIWEAGDVMIYAKDWKDLAERVKLPVKGERVERGAVLNALGTQGWELVSHAAKSGTSTTSERDTYTFKRRVP
jgi:hypothetical protein